ncbi:MAG: Rab family GTPase, partial [Candidatus Hermodarchaeota archaeon]
IVIGDPATGKTKFLERFASIQEEYLHTIGLSTYKLAVTLGENREICLMFWDIAGQHQFYMLHRPYFSGADGIILVFDVTRSSTFSNINDWWNSCLKYGLQSIPRVLVGILKDENSENERRIILPMAEHLSKKLNAPYFETSLDEEANIEIIVKTITKSILENKGEEIPLSNIEFLNAFTLESMEVTERLPDMQYIRNIERDRLLELERHKKEQKASVQKETVEVKPKDALQPFKIHDYPFSCEIKSPFDAPELDRCPWCGASGKDIKTNRPPIIILDCMLDFPEYTCKKCGHEWGNLL